MERGRFDSYVISPIAVVNLQVEDIGGEDAEKKIVGVETKPAEHRPGAEASQGRQLVEHEAPKSVADAHRFEGAAAGTFS